MEGVLQDGPLQQRTTQPRCQSVEPSPAGPESLEPLPPASGYKRAGRGAQGPDEHWLPVTRVCKVSDLPDASQAVRPVRLRTTLMLNLPGSWGSGEVFPILAGVGVC